MPSSFSLSIDSKDQLQGLIKTAVDSARVPPFFFTAVSADPDDLVSFHYGKDRNGDDISGDVVIPIHSMTKLVTSIAALQLVDRGLVSLNADIGQHLPGLAHPMILRGFGEDGEPILVKSKIKITLRHLLNHSSGLAREGDFPDLARYRKLKGFDAKTDDDPAIFFDSPQIFVFEPGTHYTYATGTDFVGKLVEVLTGISLEEYFQRNILRPIDMSSTTMLLTPALLARATLPISWRNRTTHVIQPTFPSDAEWFYFHHGRPPSLTPPPILLGGVALFSTVNDYIKLLRHILRLSPSSSNPLGEGEVRLLSEDSWRKMFEGSYTEHGAVSDLGIHKPGPLGKESGDQQWSVGGLCLNLKDWPERRKAGSGYWAGLSNILFFIDPVTGVAAVGGTQMFPVDDEIIEDLWADAQKIVYAGLLEAD